MDAEEMELSFESALEELERIVTQLERGELKLEEALALHDRGQELAAYCTSQLEKASMRVEALSPEGEIMELKSE